LFMWKRWEPLGTVLIGNKPSPHLPECTFIA
jgi:hypothetical protein